MLQCVILGLKQGWDGGKSGPLALPPGGLLLPGLGQYQYQ